MKQQTTTGNALPRRSLPWICLHALASLWLAIVLLVFLAAVLAWASLLDASRGFEYAQWHVYGRWWFLSLIGLLGINILASMLTRLPWKLRQTGFVLAHMGLLVLLAGAVQSLLQGIEGQIVFHEGERADSLLVTDRSSITISRHTMPDSRPIEFTFSPGPSDWGHAKRLALGSSNGLSVKILRFHRHAQEHVDWVADDRDYGGPALMLRLMGAGGGTVSEDWLAANVFGGEAVIGPTSYQLWPLPVDTMLDDFLNPPEDLEGSGILSMHYGDRMYRVPVAEHVGQSVPLGDTGASVEIVAYFPDARPGTDGRFLARSDQPRNPLVELKVHLPGEDEPMRQIAFSRLPLLTLDGVHGRTCPVRFWFHHTSVPLTPGAVFAQSPDGALYCRPVVSGIYGAPVEVQQGAEIAIGGQFRVAVVRYFPRARQEVTFRPVEPAPDADTPPEAAVLVELTDAQVRRELWLQRGDPQYGFQTILGERGPVTLSFDYQRVPLGYSIQLEKLVRDFDPGGMGGAGVTSVVRLIDPAQGLDDQREVSMNAPLSHKRYTFYQSQVRDGAHGRQMSVLIAAYDPGRLLKYLGSLMICLGILGIMMLRSPPSSKVRRARKNSSGSTGPSISARPLVLTACLLLPSPAWAQPSEQTGFAWDVWRHLPVQNGGRHKPLDTLARETLRAIANRGRMTDPHSGQSLDAQALYLAMVFDWQGWGELEKPIGQQHPRNVYFRVHHPDRWDRMPMLYVEFPPLRRALGLATHQQHIAPLELSTAEIQIPGVGQPRPFLLWVDSLRARQDQTPTRFEQQALGLADRFWSYQAHRMGTRLEVLPIQGSRDSLWVSLVDLLHSSWDDSTDPTGRIRQLGREFLAARAAYQAGDHDEFLHASAAFLAVIEQLGSEFEGYPQTTRIRLEVIYNRTAPFRLAWVFSMLAAIALLLRFATDWKPFYAGAWLALAVSLAAMLAGFALRVVISGRAPVANMYESVVYVALGVAVLGAISELRQRTGYVLLAASAVATFALMLADISPVVLDSSLHPLQPMLRSNFWLVTHVLPITLSYAAFAVALGVGNIVLYFSMARSRKSEVINRLTDFVHRAVQLGVLLLAVGTILGGVWADYAWGRFWGWDPKEVWALIALLGYLAVLHARHAGWIGQFGLAASVVLCFSLVVMAWYGVNFVLGAGLHSYGFGDGGRGYVLAALATQMLYVTVAAVVYDHRRRAVRRERVARRRPHGRQASPDR